MQKQILRPKIVSDPIKKLIDIRPVLPIVETKEFQALGYKYQLGVAYLIFPSATHTRKAHSLGAYQATKELTDRWLKEDLINQEEADALSAYGLLHDIGHYPLSHVTEPLFTISHDEHGIKIIDRIKKQIEATGVNFKLLRTFFTHKNKLYLGVHDKNLGTEKFDYLQRDGLLTLGVMPEIDYLQRHIYWINKKLVIDEKVVDNAKEVQDFYQKMNKKVYLQKGSMINQRVIQKMAYLALKSSEFTIQEMTDMNDFEFFNALKNSANRDVKELFAIFTNRKLFKEGVIIQDEKYAAHSKRRDKAVTVLGLKTNEFKKLYQSKTLNSHNQESLLALETKIAQKLNIKQPNIVIVPMLSTERFQAQDISILTYDGSIRSMKERYPNHFKAIQEGSEAHAAIRICTLAKYREKLSRNGKIVKDILTDMA